MPPDKRKVDWEEGKSIHSNSNLEKKFQFSQSVEEVRLQRPYGPSPNEGDTPSIRSPVSLIRPQSGPAQAPDRPWTVPRRWRGTPEGRLSCPRRLPFPRGLHP